MPVVCGSWGSIISAYVHRNKASGLNPIDRHDLCTNIHNKHYGVEAMMNDQRHTDEEETFQPRHDIFSQRAYQSALDQQIAAGQRQGAFDNLPGAGKPLQEDNDVFVPEDMRVGYRMLKTAGFAPPWVEQQKEIADDTVKLNRWLDSARARWRHAAPSDANASKHSTAKSLPCSTARF